MPGHEDTIGQPGHEPGESPVERSERAKDELGKAIADLGESLAAAEALPEREIIDASTIERRVTDADPVAPREAHPLGMTGKEIRDFVLQLLGSAEDFGYYAEWVHIKLEGPQIIVEAEWLGMSAEEVHIDLQSATSFVARRTWTIPVNEEGVGPDALPCPRCGRPTTHERREMDGAMYEVRYCRICSPVWPVFRRRIDAQVYVDGQHLGTATDVEIDS